LSRHGALKGADKQILVIFENGQSHSLDDGKTAVSVSSKQTGAVLLQGRITLGKTRQGQIVADPSVGGYAQLQAVTEKGMFLSCAHHGSVDSATTSWRRALQFERTEPTWRVVIHLSYRDGSDDPSMGPTIEMMAVQEDTARFVELG
jgi:hypothetical protein